MKGNTMFSPSGGKHESSQRQIALQKTCGLTENLAEEEQQFIMALGGWLSFLEQQKPTTPFMNVVFNDDEQEKKKADEEAKLERLKSAPGSYYLNLSTISSKTCKRLRRNYLVKPIPAADPSAATINK